MIDFNHDRKGQSAIEYLTTYGWMLLVVAIVGGAIFTTVQNQSNLQSSSGYAGADVGVNTFSTTGTGELAIELQAQGSEAIEVTNVSMSNPDTGNIAFNDTTSDFIPLGESTSVRIDGVSEGDSSGQYPLNISYNTRDLNGLQASGTISGSFDLS
jgi:hypothetical protein